MHTARVEILPPDGSRILFAGNGAKAAMPGLFPLSSSLFSLLIKKYRRQFCMGFTYYDFSSQFSMHFLLYLLHFRPESRQRMAIIIFRRFLLPRHGGLLDTGGEDAGRRLRRSR